MGIAEAYKVQDMAVKLTVHKLGPKRGIHNANQLILAAERLGYTLHTNTAYEVWGNKAEKIAFTTIDILSQVLDVAPGRLIERVED